MNIRLLLAILFFGIVPVQASEIFVPLPGNIYAFSGDGAGGACVVQAADNGLVEIRRYKADGTSEQLVRSDDPALGGRKLLVQRRLYDWQPTPQVLACDDKRLLFFGYGARGEVDTLVKEYGQSTRLLFKYGDRFQRIVLPRTTVETVEYVIGYSHYSSAGRFAVTPFVFAPNVPTDKMSANLLELNATTGPYKVFLDQNELVVTFREFSIGCFTLQNFWNVRTGRSTDRHSLWKTTNGGISTEVATIPFKLVDADDKGVACNADTAVLPYKDQSGLYRFDFVTDTDYWRPKPLLTSQTTTEGIPLSDSTSHSLTDDGRLLFLMSQGGKSYLVELGPKPGPARILKSSSDAPVGTIEKAAASANRYLFLQTEGGFGGKKLYLALQPRLTATSISGRAGDMLTLPCVDCSFGAQLVPKLTINGRDIPAVILASGLQFRIPADLTAGNANGIVHVSTVKLSFALQVVQTVVPAVVEAVTDLMGERKASFAQGDVISVWGKNLALQEGKWNGVLPLPTELGCRVIVGGEPASLYYCSPTQINAVLPPGLALGRQLLIVERLKPNGTLEARSQPVEITITATSPTFLGNRLYPVFLQNITADPTGQTFVGGDTPAKIGDILIMYATGLGITDPPLAKGYAAAARVVTQVEVLIQGLQTELLGVAASPQYPGLYQIAFRVLEVQPDERGVALLEVKVDGRTAKAVYFNLMPF